MIEVLQPKHQSLTVSLFFPLITNALLIKWLSPAKALTHGFRPTVFCMHASVGTKRSNNTVWTVTKHPNKTRLLRISSLDSCAAMWIFLTPFRMQRVRVLWRRPGFHGGITRKLVNLSVDDAGGTASLSEVEFFFSSPLPVTRRAEDVVKAFWLPLIGFCKSLVVHRTLRWGGDTQYLLPFAPTGTRRRRNLIGLLWMW